MPLPTTSKGKQPEKVKKLETDEDGKPKDADLLSSCTIAMDGYRDAVARLRQRRGAGCRQRRPGLLGIEAQRFFGRDGHDDHDVTAQVDVTMAALTTGFRWPGDQCHRGYGGARPDRDVGRQRVGSGRR